MRLAPLSHIQSGSGCASSQAATYCASTREEQLALIGALKWTLDLSAVVQNGIREFHPAKD